MNRLLSDFDFVLPPDLIANTPVSPRDSSKLLWYKDGILLDYIFSDLVNLLPEKSLLIFNDTKVVKSRIKFLVNSKNSELFFASELSGNFFEVLCKPASVFKVGSIVELPGGLKVEVVNQTSEGTKIVKVLNSDFNYFEYLDNFGEVPLPPYIDLKNKSANDFESVYQTVYSRSLGSVAAPTAGLHFTNELLNKLKNKGIKFEFITLQVGLGTFLPIRTENIDEHIMHTEKFHISDSSANIINECKSKGYTVISVGTTTLRAIQSVYDTFGLMKSGYFDTNIFITPGYSNWFIDALITNFHLPKSSLFILVSAILGLENAKLVYSYAIDKKYRFYSFGDSSILWI